jgi:DNA-binding IscR family transcriptional regulator
MLDHYKMVLNFIAQADKSLTAGEIAEATGIERKDVDKVMNKLKKEEKIVSPKRCYWEINK